MPITPVTVTLTEEVEHGKVIYREVTFARRMKGKDMVAMDAVQGGMRKTYALYASMAGVPMQVFLEMNAEDLEAVAQAVADLTGKSSAARETPEQSPAATA
jgi:hypothetical protein